MMFFNPLISHVRHIFYYGEKILRYDRLDMTFIFRNSSIKQPITIETRTILYGRTFQTCSGNERALLFGRRNSSCEDGPIISVVGGIS